MNRNEQIMNTPSKVLEAYQEACLNDLQTISAQSRARVLRHSSAFLRELRLLGLSYTQRFKEIKQMSLILATMLLILAAIENRPQVKRLIQILRRKGAKNSQKRAPRRFPRQPFQNIPPDDEDTKAEIDIHE